MMPNPFIGVPVPIILLAILGAFCLLVGVLWGIAVVINLVLEQRLISKTGGKWVHGVPDDEEEYINKLKEED